MRTPPHAPMPMRKHRLDSLPAAGAAAGLVGGLVASWLMVEFQRRVWPPPKGGDGESSTSKLARRIAGLGGGDGPTDRQARIAGAFVHYALGAGLGTLYGATASVRPVVAMGAGLPFGIATEIVIDQAIVPALGLSKPFWKCPAAAHLRGLTAHLVFGVAIEVSRRLGLAAIEAGLPNAVGRPGSTIAWRRR